MKVIKTKVGPNDWNAARDYLHNFGFILGQQGACYATGIVSVYHDAGRDLSIHLANRLAVIIHGDYEDWIFVLDRGDGPIGTASYDWDFPEITRDLSRLDKLHNLHEEMEHDFTAHTCFVPKEWTE